MRSSDRRERWDARCISRCLFGSTSGSWRSRWSATRPPARQLERVCSPVADLGRHTSPNPWCPDDDEVTRPRASHGVVGTPLRVCVKPHTMVRMPSWSALADLSHPGDSIRERRIELGWTQAELAERSCIPQADISRIENGRLDARWSTVQRISTALAGTRERPRRTLASGRRVAETRAPTSKKWSAKGTTIEITSAKK